MATGCRESEKVKKFRDTVNNTRRIRSSGGTSSAPTLKAGTTVSLFDTGPDPNRGLVPEVWAVTRGSQPIVGSYPRRRCPESGAFQSERCPSDAARKKRDPSNDREWSSVVSYRPVGAAVCPRVSPALALVARARGWVVRGPRVRRRGSLDSGSDEEAPLHWLRTLSDVPPVACGRPAWEGEAGDGSRRDGRRPPLPVPSLPADTPTTRDRGAQGRGPVLAPRRLRPRVEPEALACSAAPRTRRPRRPLVPRCGRSLGPGPRVATAEPSAGHASCFPTLPPSSRPPSSPVSRRPCSHTEAPLVQTHSRLPPHTPRTARGARGAE